MLYTYITQYWGKYIIVLLLYLQHMGIFRKSDGSSKFCCINFSIPEVKIFFTFCYLLFIITLLWNNFSIQNARFDTTFSIIHTYVQCMSGGIRKGLDCEAYRREFEHRSFPQLVMTYFMLFSFLSYSNLLYLVRITTTKHFIVKTIRKLNYNRASLTSSSMVTS